MVVDVITSAIDPENDVITYSYTVTGGVIKGTGPKVQWDLRDAQPGTYTITAGVDDGCGICGKTKSQVVTVAECDAACGLVECPSIEMSGPIPLTLGAVADFTAHLMGGSQQSVTFMWTVANGEIVSGQGGPSIKVRIPRNLNNQTLVVTVKVGGTDPQAMCMDSLTREFQ